MARKANPRSKGHGKGGKTGAQNRRTGRSGTPQREGKPQSRYGGNWVWGKHAVAAAINNQNRKIFAIHFIADHSEQVSAWIGAAERDPTSLTLVETDRNDLDTGLPDGAVHQGIALNAAPLKEMFIDELDPKAMQAGPTPPLVVVLDQISDPHNVGAILRSAAAFGIDALIVQDRRAPGETGTLAKAASGALEHVPIIQQTNLKRAIDQLKELGYWCVGFDSEAPDTVSQVAWDAPTAIVLGAEGKGLRRLVREACDQFVRLPTKPPIASLNVSNAAAIAFYEARRG